MKDWTYHMPTKIIFGINTLDRIKDIVDKISPKRILLVTGRHSMQKLGITDRVKILLKDYNIILFNRVEPNPSVDTVEKGLKTCENEKCDLVISLGGGSAIDVGKTIAILMRNKGSVKEYLYGDKTIQKNGLPFIAIPTTAGTASEITKYSVLTDLEKKIKKTFKHDFMYPDFAIIDSMLAKSMPREVTASTGMDALAHAIESYWSKKSQPITEIFALKSIELIYNNLIPACNNPDDFNFRINMSKASLFAGFAFSNTGTNVLHAVSFPLTAKFNIPHGHACVLPMTEFMKFNKDSIYKKMKKISGITGAKTIEEGINDIQSMLEDTGIPMKLSELGIDESKVGIIIEEGYKPDQMKKNPKPITKNDLRRILINILK